MLWQSGTVYLKNKQVFFKYGNFDMHCNVLENNFLFSFLFCYSFFLFVFLFVHLSFVCFLKAWQKVSIILMDWLTSLHNMEITCTGSDCKIWKIKLVQLVFFSQLFKDAFSENVDPIRVSLSIGPICQGFLVSLWNVEGLLVNSFEGFCPFFVHVGNLDTTWSFSFQYKLFFIQYKVDVSRQPFKGC